MAQFIVNTTGTSASISLPGLGVSLVHPVIDLDLISTYGFEYADLAKSEALQQALDVGHITASDGTNPVESISFQKITTQVSSLVSGGVTISDVANYYNTSRVKNSGVVKVNDHNGIWGPTPHVAEVEQKITVSFPLTISSATDWPATLSNPQDLDIYDTSTDKWLENPVPFQINTWRIILTYSRQSASTTESIVWKIRNSISGFEIDSTAIVAKGHTTGNAGMILVTIADSASIGIGYEMWLEASDDMDITIDSITRVNDRRDNV